MASRTAKVRFLIGVGSASFSYSPGDEVEAGAPGEIDLEEAGRHVSAGNAEWVEKRAERATRKTPERMTRRDRKGEAK